MPSSRPGPGLVPARPSAPLRRSRPTPALRTLAAAVVALATLAGAVPAAAAGAEATAAYRPPVEAPVVDSFRPPATPYAAGNRGIDYATTPGEQVRASAEGEVTFAGRIGPSSHVVVLHPDGLRTSYSFLSTVGVDRGARLAAGDVVGTAGPVLHFGVRAGERYIDPAVLLAGGAVEVHLIPVELREPQDATQERRWLVDLVEQVVGEAWRGAGAGVGAVGAAADGALSWAADAAVVAAAEARSLSERAAQTGWEALRGEVESLWTQAVVLAAYASQLPVTPLFVLHVVEQWERAERFRAAQAHCTPASQPPPPPSPGRRIAVLVAGFGSSSEGADVLDVDTAALGYAHDDVVQFSYAGGRTPARGSLAGVRVSEYGPEHSTGDLEVAGQRLGELIDVIAAANPGVDVDVVAHSQGGIVARLALDDHRPVANLVTLGAPHHGADAATANALLGTTGAGEAAQAVTSKVTGGSLDGASAAAGQLAETSGFIHELNDRPPPARTRVTSIAARGDLTVAGLQSSLEGATNAMIPLDGLTAHAELPGSPLTQRELALALAGKGPTCRDLTGDLALAAGISMGEDALGLTAGLGALWLDRQVPTPSGAFRRPPGPSRPVDPLPVAAGGG